MATSRLTEAAKTFVVQSLACFDTPSVVAEAVRKEFGETITRQSVEGFDPTKRAGQKLSVKWRAIFEETRKTFLEDTAAIAISHRAVRLRALQRMADKAEGMGNMKLASELHEQAAKEMGNAFTNRREITGKDGGAIETRQQPDLSGYSESELAQMITIEEARERRNASANQGK